jgi:Tfp pilus assembly protein FimT
MFLANPSKPARRKKPNGFSTLELAVVLGMVLTVSGIAVPSISSNLRVYQLNSTASMVADQFKSTRFDAIRRNIPQTCFATPATPGYQLWTDTAGTGSGTYVNTERTTTLSGSLSLVGLDVVTDSGALEGALGITGSTTMSGSTSEVSLTFDSRGAVSSSTAVNVFYVGYPGNPAFGYRAVVVMPSGSVQVWTPDGNGSWNQAN